MQRRKFLAGLAVAAGATGCTTTMGLATASRTPLVDTLATSETRALFENMKRLSGEGVMFGHQNTLLYGYSWRGEPQRSDVNDVVGDFPAVYGWDVMDVLRNDRPGEIPGAGPDRLRECVREAHSRGGVSTFSWHKPNPVTKTDSWDKTPAVGAIIPGGRLHDEYRKELDKVGAFFRSLTDASGKPIPVWFRPWHEHTGDWFWWGKPNASQEEYVALWQFTVSYLRDECAAHNLLYAYSTDVFDSAEQYFEYYPGDEWVDMLGYDDYHSVKQVETQPVFIRRLGNVARWARERGKLAALTETGIEAVPDEDWWTTILLAGLNANPDTRQISYALVWRNANPAYDRKEHFYAPYPGQKSAENFRAFYEDPATLFERDLPDLYS
jgi:mannan endo-1,4-beta-mannosidase